MRGNWMGGAVIGLMLLAGPASAHMARADKCGCHRQYGVRHCHPNLKTSHCEAPAKATPKKTVSLPPGSQKLSM